MLVFSEKLAVFFERKHIAVRINARFVKLVKRYKMVSDLVARIAEHKNNLFCAHCYAFKANCKTVSRKNRENNADCFAAELCSDILGDCVNACIVALASCNDGFGYRNNILVAKLKAVALSSLNNAAANDLRKIVALTDDRAADTS